MASFSGSGNGSHRPVASARHREAKDFITNTDSSSPGKKALTSEARYVSDTVDRLVEREILPRLLLAHSARGPMNEVLDTASDSTSITCETAHRFADSVLQHDASALFDMVESAHADGADVESILIHLLAPAARRLGEYWEADSCDFVDVTMGLWRLQEVMRHITQAYPAPRFRAGYPRSALFAPMPGDQHSFGTMMIEEVFARAGWDSEALPETQRSKLLQICSEHSFDLVGLTVTNDCHSGELANLVTAIRSVSQCSQVKIILGGRAVQTDPSLIELAGADGTADTAVAALALADRLVPPPAHVGRSVLQPGTPAPDAHT